MGISMDFPMIQMEPFVTSTSNSTGHVSNDLVVVVGLKKDSRLSNGEEESAVVVMVFSFDSEGVLEKFP
eukprot:CAMPEP_0195534906 /NCGR_PEP_ID=MMETSP0794_2-20130614/43288_1 /TAXON_ID=515487 /ORGANISM="Stephanopyxis turris, Strain CCMP 815" /LENGTH=68 /DNA_ID=CAMNT_0040667895 /DNA_START=125 /DNA_END=331 /DNA_ORIENTATION=-